MKLIVKDIKSISDVITNSSSEVFVMCKGDAEYYYNLEGTEGCVTIYKITWDFLEENIMNEWQMVCDVCDIGYNTLVNNCNVNEVDCKAFLELYHDVIEKKLIGLYWVDIKDHFADAVEVLDNARSDSFWSESGR